MPESATAQDAKLAINGGTPVCRKPIPFMAPKLHPEDIAAAHAVLESGMLRAHTNCAELERQFADKTDAKFGLTCSNGTCALQLAYEGLLERGDEVIVPAWTYIATASMLVARGCKVIFCDSLEDTMQVDPADIEQRLTPNTKAIAVTHLYGMPVDIDAIQTIAEKHNLKVIYDCAQSHLATYKGKGIGAFGDACTYSFYATKNLGTGEGGLVTVNDESLNHEIGLIRSHGESDKYLHTRIGYNYRMNDITGAIGLSRLQRLEEETNARRAAADAYDKLFAEVEAVETPTRTEGADAAWHLYSLKLNLDTVSCTRDEFTKALIAEGVPCAVHYPKSLTDQPAFADVVTDHPPVARRLATRVFSIPMHHELTDEQVRNVVDAVAKVASAYAK
ncbi:MAG TPA: DegT/DnrJ/EryC1/StrS family aminotransferase [Phycisphaerales bacterium]|nr:DegT/DnrJ/EryC1/StrS family aminotransferase [Phycisphaerales bacterium]